MGGQKRALHDLAQDVESPPTEQLRSVKVTHRHARYRPKIRPLLEHTPQRRTCLLYRECPKLHRASEVEHAPNSKSAPHQEQVKMLPGKPLMQSFLMGVRGILLPSHLPSASCVAQPLNLSFANAAPRHGLKNCATNFERVLFQNRNRSRFSTFQG